MLPIPSSPTKFPLNHVNIFVPIDIYGSIFELIKGKIKGVKIIGNQVNFKGIYIHSSQLRIDPLKRRRFGFVSINVSIENEDKLTSEIYKILN